MTDIDKLEALAKAAITSGLPGDRMMFDLHAMDPEGMIEIITEIRDLRERRDGPGSAPARLNYLHGELNARFPAAIDVFSSEPAEPKFIAVIDALIAEVRTLREDKARLDSGCIMINGRDSWGEDCKIDSRGNDLRKMIDEAMASRAKDQS